MPIHSIAISVTLDTGDPVVSEFLSDVITTALAGGINYWATVISYDPATATAVLDDVEDDMGGHVARVAATHLALDADVVARGIKTVMEARAPFYDPNGTRSQCDDVPFLTAHWASVVRSAVLALDAGEIDADAADVIVQAALFREVRYG
jgi:hypothetical protein